MGKYDKISKSAHYPAGSPQAWAQKVGKVTARGVKMYIEPFAKGVNSVIPGPPDNPNTKGKGSWSNVPKGPPSRNWKKMTRR